MCRYEFKSDEEMKTYFYKELKTLIFDKKVEIIEQMDTSPAVLVESLMELVSLQHTAYVMWNGFDILTFEQADHFMKDIEIFMRAVDKNLIEGEEEL